MQGLLNRSFHLFLRDTYGPELWTGLAEDLSLDPDGFDLATGECRGAFLRLAEAAGRRLEIPLPLLLEEFGLYLHSLPRVRRLVRLCARDFGAFVAFLPDLPERLRMALPGLDIPALEVADAGAEGFRVTVAGGPMQAAVIAGFLRAVSDDFGVLSLVTAGDDGAVHVLPLGHGYGMPPAPSVPLRPGAA